MIIIRFKNDRYPAATIDIWVCLSEFADDEAKEKLKALVLSPEEWTEEQP